MKTIPSQLLVSLFASTSIGISVVDEKGQWVYCNPALQKMLGYTSSELTALDFSALTHPADTELSRQHYASLLEGQPGTPFEKRYLHRDGHTVWARVTSTLANVSGERRGIAMVEDITELRRERLDRELLKYDLGERVKELTCLHGAARALADEGQSVGLLLLTIAELLPPAFQFPGHTTAEIRVGRQQAQTLGFRPSEHALRSAFSTSWGDRGEVLVSYHEAPAGFLKEEQALLDSLAEMLRVELERRHAHGELFSSTERLELALSAAEMGFWEWDVVNNRLYASQAVAAFMGLKGPLDSELGALSQFIHPDDRVRLYTHLKRIAEEPGYPASDIEYRLARPEGGWRTVHGRGFVDRDAAGRALRVFAVITDVSIRHALEQELRQNSKMDALGLVTGTVAHDFNNVLTAMLSGSQLVMTDLPEGAAHDAARAVSDAALTGTALTRQLLSFSRRPELRPTLTDVSVLVTRNLPVLARLFGAGVTMTHQLAAGCVTMANAAQLDQVLLLLALNAREAMGGHGAVSLSVRPARVSADQLVAAADARPGPHLELAFEDSGSGMLPEVLARAFEPFFTTHPERGARGLGLAVALGAVRQHDGHVMLESEVGKGTAVRVFLPAIV